MGECEIHIIIHLDIKVWESSEIHIIIIHLNMKVLQRSVLLAYIIKPYFLIYIYIPIAKYTTNISQIYHKSTAKCDIVPQKCDIVPQNCNIVPQKE